MNKSITLEEAKQIVADGNGVSAEQIKKWQNERLHELVDYARTNSPFFKKLYAQLPDNYSLEDLPETTKADLMVDYNSWPTDGEVTLEGVQDYLKSLNDDPNLKYLDKYTGLATSGTSGNRMPMLRDSLHNLIHGQMLVQRLRKDAYADPRCQHQMRMGSVIYCDPNASAYAGFMRMKKASGLPDNMMKAFSILSPMEDLLAELNDFQPEYMTGYPSVISEIAAAQLDGKIDIHPMCVSCSAETMTDQHYSTIRKAWGDDCHIMNNFCSTEGGEIAMSCRYNHLHVNEDWVILEPIDKDGKPTTPGELSDSVLVTDLTNFIQPIIRYKVDDHILWHTEGCECGNPRPWIEVRGRKGGVDFSFGGKPLNTLLISAMLEEYKEVVNYQVIKNSETEIEVRLVTFPQDKHDEIIRHFADKVQDYASRLTDGAVKVVVGNGAPLHNKRGGKMLHYVTKDKVE